MGPKTFEKLGLPVVLKIYDRPPYFLSEREVVPNYTDVPPKIKIRKARFANKIAIFCLLLEFWAL